MTTYRTQRPDPKDDTGLGRIPRLICRVIGHSWLQDTWIQRLSIEGDTAMVNIPCITCRRCMLSMVLESRIDWMRAGYIEREAMEEKLRGALGNLPAYEEPPEGLGWMDELEEEG